MHRARNAGDEAARRFAFEDAARYYGWAVEAHLFTGDPGPRSHAELLLSLSKAQRSAGRTGDADNTAARAIHLGLQHGLHDLVLRATGLRRPSVGMGTIPDSLSRSALEVVLQHTADTDPTRVRALAQLAVLPPFEPDLSRSRTMSARGRACGTPRGLCAAARGAAGSALRAQRSGRGRVAARGRRTHAVDLSTRVGAPVRP
jgi:hypothetical protein